MLGPPDRRRMIASERSLRSELDSTVIIAHDNIVEHVKDSKFGILWEVKRNKKVQTPDQLLMNGSTR